jgi:hypothetical protein
MNLIAGPFVCPGGKMILEENVSNPLPGTTYTIIHWYCVDKQWLGMEFTKDKRTLLVTFAPASDLQSWVVTLVLVP